MFFTATKEPVKDAAQNTSHTVPLNDLQPTTSWDLKRDMKSLWVYRPPSLQAQDQESVFQQAVFKAPHLLTRLAKPFNFRIDPYFSKDHFEPFERRGKPVTLVAFRRNALMPRRTVERSVSAEIAELQSPYNEIGSLWREEPDVFNV
ncbi:unnamed protein product [Leptosia nina]|uniref:Uncharacterized protein n=1 Tax=Leptosia nina TaxID=320188 RepID=A0AAV1JX47_9NEOP